MILWDLTVDFAQSLKPIINFCTSIQSVVTAVLTLCKANVTISVQNASKKAAATVRQPLCLCRYLFICSTLGIISPISFQVPSKAEDSWAYCRSPYAFWYPQQSWSICRAARWTFRFLLQAPSCGNRLALAAYASSSSRFTPNSPSIARVSLNVSSSISSIGMSVSV